MNRNPIYIAILIAFLALSFKGICQEFTVSGFITDSENVPLPGVTVLEQNADNGVITNIEGQYSIQVSSPDAILEFRFVGMETQIIQVNNTTEINVVLKTSLYKMDEVVVTALGISKETKSLGYSVTSVGSDELGKGGDKNMLNALQGKVAGVNITSSSGAPGASSRIMVRGVSSLSGSNQPLFVVDGIPVNNSQSGSNSINGGTDFGNKVNDINMNDIESVSFLKGASGTALYGSRAANGVIIITSKKGKNKDKASVSYSGGVAFEQPLRLVKYQNDFGQGIYGDHVLYENMSWGPAFDNRYHPWGNVVGDSLRVKSYRALPGNVKEFFDTGISTNHAISVSGGNDLTTYYVSYSNVFWDGIFPSKSDSYSKHTFALRGSQKIGKNLLVSASLNYIHKANSFVPTGQGDASVYNQIMQSPRDISLLELEDQELPWNLVDNHYSLYTVNPYFILYNNGNKNNENRIYGSLELNYNLPLNLKATWRLGADISNQNISSWREFIRPEGNNEFSAVFDPGSKGRSYSQVQQLNSDVLLSWQKTIRDFDIGLMTGHVINERNSTGFTTAVSYLGLPGFPNLSNSLESPNSSESEAMVRMFGVYGALDLSYKSIVFLSGTIRNEWNSTLPVKNNSYFFPGLSTSFVFTELFPNASNIISFGKIRASIAQVGNGAPAYYVDPVYQQAAHSDGFGYFTFPTSTGVNSYEVGNFIGNPELRPEMTTEYEVGVDLRFFQNRIGLDAAYYNKSTVDLIWASPIAFSSGYSFQMQNLGEMVNYGIEALVTLKPVQTENFSWVITSNFTQNFNELKSLNTQLEKAELNALRVDGGQQISWVALPGSPVGVFQARAPKYTADGKMVVDNQGLPVAGSELKSYGNSQYRFFGGLGNTFSYKSFSLGFMFDYRIGGIMYSRTKDITLWAGTVPETLYNNREPFIIPNSVYEVGRDENGEPIYAENTIPLDRVKLVNYWGNGGSELDGASLIDKSFIKLREITIGYTLPEKWLTKIPVQSINIGVSGKNIWLWTPEKQTYIDPELTTFGNDLGADFGEYGAQPSVRSVSFNLKVDF
jgi:TonB-linked SusC/RagA family outer membrane protein